MKYLYSEGNYSYNLFAYKLNNNRIEITLMMNDGIHQFDIVKVKASPILEYVYSDVELKRINAFAEFELKKISKNSKIYICNFDWKSYDIIFYLEFWHNGQLLYSSKRNEINFLQFSKHKKVLNDSVYQIMIDRYIENNENSLWENDDFFAGGNFNTINNDLSRIKKMGFSIVYLSPIMKTCTYHGYNQLSLDVLNDSFGTANDLIKLSTDLLKENIKIGIEVVLNHMSVYSDKFKQSVAEEDDFFYLYDHNNGYVRYRECYDLCKINYENRKNVEYVFKILRGIIKKYNIEFLRLDCCDHLHNSIVNTLATYSNEKDVYVVGECWSNYNNFFARYNVDGATNYQLYGLLISFFVKKEIHKETFQYELERMNYQYGTLRLGSMLNFIDNHDLPRIQTIANNKKEILAMLSFIYIFIGVPCVYYGLENYDISKEKHIHNRMCFSWNDIDEEIINEISYLSSIRKQFRDETIEYSFEEDLFAFSRKTLINTSVEYVYNPNNYDKEYNGINVQAYGYTVICV